MNDNPITYEIGDKGFVVKYLSPSRPFGDLREELNNDVKKINEKYGKVYLAFSSGVDSQVMLRCFLDMKADFEPFFLYVKGLNDFEYKVVKESEQFYGISINVLKLDIEEFKMRWLRRKMDEKHLTLIHYPFEWASQQLPENFPMIMSGANEPALIGGSEKGVYIYHNYSESLLLRFRLLGQHRTMLDFPYSAESLAAYYCDNLIKTWADVKNYYIMNDLVSAKKNYKPVGAADRFNYYVKGFLKGQYFKKDILWPAKATGYEKYPDWMVPHFNYPTETHVSVCYQELTEHFESCSGTVKEFRDWNF